MVGMRKREGVENVSIEGVVSDGPFAGVRPNAGEVLSVIGDNNILRKDPTTDSVCEGDGPGLRGGEGDIKSVAAT